MRLIDEQYLRQPDYGSPRMTDWLKTQGHQINHKRVERLMKLMGLQAITPGPHTSKPNPEHPVYPYLLKGVAIERKNQVWSADITYIPMQRGFLYGHTDQYEFAKQRRIFCFQLVRMSRAAPHRPFAVGLLGLVGPLFMSFDATQVLNSRRRRLAMRRFAKPNRVISCALFLACPR